MQKFTLLLPLAIVAVCVPARALAQVLSPEALTQTYCRSCHNQSTKSGGFSLDGATPRHPAAHPEIWERVIKKINAREMPPAGMPRPDESSLRDLVFRLTSGLDAAVARSPFAGRPVLRRLNRAEYTNAIRDLLDIELPLAEDLPQDQVAAGFDNIADALSLSPLLLERYLKVARKVSNLATGTGDDSPVVEIFPAKASQAVWQGDGMPFGTRGGLRVTYYFPRDGDYDLRAFLTPERLSPLEGVRFFRLRLSQVKAGSHNITVTFPDEFAEREGPVLNVGGPGGRPLGGPLDVLGSAIRPTLEFRLDGRRLKLFEIGGMNAGEAAFDGQPGPPALGRIEIAGPFHPTGAGITPSRAKIFLCRPAPNSTDEQACALRILKPLVRHAFRRDVSAQDLLPFRQSFAAARKYQTFEESISAAIRDILLAPDFLFRLEFDPANSTPGTLYPLSDFELASRLSFFLWSSIPDEALLSAASTGKLRQPATLEQQVRRMLTDRRASALLDNFAAQWLGLPQLELAAPDRQLFPTYDSALAADFRSETRLFLSSIIRENRSALEILRANYTYLNERLAAHYGIPGVTGPGFRRVPLPEDSQRGGLLTHGSILVLTSHSTRTSPVLRGKWILDNLLNSPPAPPPANVPPLPETSPAGRKLSSREQVEMHRSNPACASCHARIDPLGFSLENFDAIGRWRTHDEGLPINASAQLSGGAAFAGPQGLKSVLLQRSSEFVHATLERLMTYALGRELDPRDQPAIRAILRQTQPTGFRFHDLILATVQSVPFQMRQKQE
jgi:hypothetical protein